MFITFKTRSQAKNYIKRNNRYNYSHSEGCGCCYQYCSIFIDGNKVVTSSSGQHQGACYASATVIGRIIGR